jgi:hypothetical protein
MSYITSAVKSYNSINSLLCYTCKKSTLKNTLAYYSASDVVVRRMIVEFGTGANSTISKFTTAFNDSVVVSLRVPAL